MFTIISYIAIFIIGAILGVLFGRVNREKANALNAAVKKAKAEAEALIKKAKKN